MTYHFDGMSDETFSYEEFEHVREALVKEMHESLTEEDKKFLLNFKNVQPDWSIYNFETFPAVQWKMQNLQKLKEAWPAKHAEQYETLKKKLFG